MNIKEIEEEIKTLECGDTTYYNIQKLAWLYTVREHFSQNKEIEVAIDNEEVL